MNETRQDEQPEPQAGGSDANRPRSRISRSGEGLDSLLNHLRQQHAERGAEPEGPSESEAR